MLLTKCFVYLFDMHSQDCLIGAAAYLLLLLFSPLGKVAGRAIYFADVFLYF